MKARAGGAQRAFAGLLASASILFTLTGGSSAWASGHVISRWSAAEAGAFWTPARMREATPIEVDGRGSLLGPTGKPEQGGASMAGGNAAGADFEAVADPTAPQYRVNGAIFLDFQPFGYGRCSGTAVRSGNRSVVITAAHCINSGGRRGRWFPRRWVFVPAYRFGQRPFGVFPAKWIDTTKQWRVSGSENYDVGAAVVGRNQRGELLGRAVGGDRIAFHLKPRQTFEVHGYPAEAPFDGETQRVCRDMPFLGHDPSSFLFPGPLNLANDCEVSGGASGGGWTIGGDVLNSVTDYGYGGGLKPDYGAYFGQEVARLFHRAERQP